MKRLFVSIISISLLVSAGVAQQRSVKRGVGWDEKTVSLGESHCRLLSNGVSWVYNWGPDPKSPLLYSGNSMGFAPMCWNGSYDEKRIRDYVSVHPETKYLLGFNEPNFSAQANMTPAAAAAKWPDVERLADELGLILVGPALNFTAERVGGRIWNPYEWLDEFVRLYPDARMDCLALHCYMNWYSSNTWFATEYIYKDLYDPAKKDVYGRYPNLVAWLDSYKESHGRFPRMMLTEFCSWENDGTITGADFQIDQMTQKVQMLELSDLVEGYAWFMANGSADTYPYFSIFQSNTPSSDLSVLGKVYVNMSTFDTAKFYGPGEKVFAKDYVDATRDLQQIKVRPNTDTGCDSPLQIEVPASGWMQYQIEAPVSGSYSLSIRMNSTADNKMMLYVDGKRVQTETLTSTAGMWTERAFHSDLVAGCHNVMFYNSSSSPFLMDEWSFSSSSGVADVEYEDSDKQSDCSMSDSCISAETIYDLSGYAVSGAHGSGVCLVSSDSGFRKVIF